MQFNTHKLIMELLNQELKKSDRIPTLFYHEEVKEAKRDFINHMKKRAGKKSWHSLDNLIIDFTLKNVYNVCIT